MLLTHTYTPEDVKALERAQLPELCHEVRQAILTESAAHGGHVAPNLSVVELSVALHRVFDSPTDKLVFDVSHQTYTHKLLTGRTRAFIDPAHFGEVSGFSSPAESEHDLFAMGHTSTSVSLACGLAKARDLAGETYNVVAVIGDGSLSGGLAFEGLNNAAELASNLVVIINDNDQSIAENHGGLYRNLAELRASNGTCPNNFFTALGLDYRYLEDGNDVLALTDMLTELRGCDHPVVLHIHSVKGLGYAPAEADPEGWHHVGPFDIATGVKTPVPRACTGSNDTYAEITGSYLLDRMHKDRRVVGISAATPYIMGFTPERRRAAGAQFVDVGIAEEHAVTYACALATAGSVPVFGVYGTFLQRAFDELWHDLCLNDAPATLLVFGCSAYGNSDQTHLGFFDISEMRSLPNMRYLAPVCREEYLAMLDWSLAHREHPVAIRVPGTGVVSRPDLAPAVGTADANFDICRYKTVRRGSDIAILALGDFFELGEKVADLIADKTGTAPTLINPRFATEYDTVALDALADGHRVVVMIEDGVLDGGWGEGVCRYLANTDLRVASFGLPSAFPDRFSADKLLEESGMTIENMAEAAIELL